MQAELEKLHFFAKPKLALDAVGGSSALRIADTLAEVGLQLQCRQQMHHFGITTALTDQCISILDVVQSLAVARDMPTTNLPTP